VDRNDFSDMVRGKKMIKTKPIKVHESIYNRLNRLKASNETFNDLMNRLIEYRKENVECKIQLDDFHKEKEKQILTLIHRVKSLGLRSGGRISGDDLISYILGIFKGGRE